MWVNVNFCDSLFVKLNQLGYGIYIYKYIYTVIYV